jgi:hypothetical protein
MWLSGALGLWTTKKRSLTQKQVGALSVKRVYLTTAYWESALAEHSAGCRQRTCTVSVFQELPQGGGVHPAKASCGGSSLCPGELVQHSGLQWELSKLADDFDDIWELSLFWWIYIPAELRLPEGLEVPFCYWNLVRRARHGIGYSRNSSPRLLERRLHYLDELVVL